MLVYTAKNLSELSWLEWDDLVNQSDESNLFASSSFCRHLPYVQRIGVFENEKWVAGMIFPVDKEGVAAMRSSYIIPYIQPIFKKREMKRVKAMQYKRKILTAIIAFFQNNYTSVTLPIYYNVEDYVPFMKAHFALEQRYTFVNDIRDLDSVWQGFDSKIRNHIRKAGELGIIQDAALNYFDFDLAVHYEPEYERLHWKSLVRGLIEDDLAMTFIAFIDDKPVGGLFLAYDNACAYNLLSYYDKDCQVRGIPSALIWHAISYAASRNIKAFDLEGSVLLDIEKFFQCFGGNHRPYVQLHWDVDSCKMRPILYVY